MKLGVNVGYFGALGSPAEELDFARQAERLGYDSVWASEPYGHDGATVLAWFASVTERVTLGSAILAIPGRTAAMTAQTAATLDLISGGRLILGLGTSGPQVSEGWHGIPFAKQLLRTREYVDVVRMALRREPVAYEGETIQLPLPGGEGRPLKLILRPERETIPIYLAALGPKNLALSGEIADGWLPIWWSPEHSAGLRRPLEEGAARVGRPAADIAVCPTVTFRVDDDLETARAAMRPALSLYIGGMGSRGRNFYKNLIASYGYEEVTERIQNLYLDGKKAEATELITDKLVDMLCLCGPADRVADRIAAYREAGVDTLIGTPAALTHEDRIEQLRRLAEAAA